MNDLDQFFTLLTAMLLRVEGYQAAGLTYRCAVAAATDVGLDPGKVLAAGALSRE